VISVGAKRSAIVVRRVASFAAGAAALSVSVAVSDTGASRAHAPLHTQIRARAAATLRIVALVYNCTGRREAGVRG
jgi:hypothetical protein